MPNPTQPHVMQEQVDVLTAVPGVSAWVLRRARTREVQRYLVFGKPDASRAVDKATLNVSVFHATPDGLGESRFTLPGAQAKVDRAKVEEAVFSAGLSTNPPYTLPGPMPMSKVEAA